MALSESRAQVLAPACLAEALLKAQRCEREGRQCLSSRSRVSARDLGSSQVPRHTPPSTYGHSRQALALPKAQACSPPNTWEGQGDSQRRAKNQVPGLRHVLGGDADPALTKFIPNLWELGTGWAACAVRALLTTGTAMADSAAWGMSMTLGLALTYPRGQRSHTCGTRLLSQLVHFYHKPRQVSMSLQTNPAQHALLDRHRGRVWLPCEGGRQDLT